MTYPESYLEAVVEAPAKIGVRQLFVAVWRFVCGFDAAPLLAEFNRLAVRCVFVEGCPPLVGNLMLRTQRDRTTSYSVNCRGLFVMADTPVLKAGIYVGVCLIPRVTATGHIYVECDLMNSGGISHADFCTHQIEVLENQPLQGRHVWQSYTDDVSRFYGGCCAN
jgi:hypothetical protein